MVAFKQSVVQGLAIVSPTSLQFGPDGRLYVSEIDGSILALTVSGNATSGYSVVARETIELVKGIPNHNDDGAFNAAITSRQVTGILVTGTSDNPVIYVSSSDPRIGGGASKGDTGLDTNSGVLSKLTLQNGTWVKTDLVIGLPRSEENHAVNGLQIDPETGHILLAVGGNTNVGAPSQEFAYLSEYAYSSAIVRIDVAAIEAMPSQTYRGQTYKYVLPTVNDPTRSAAGDVLAAGQPEIYGGNDGLNQARLTPDSPVQIYSTGYRNLYDLVVTESGQIYGIDNSGNPTWGGPPIYRQPNGTFGTAPTADVTNMKNDGSGSINQAPLHLIEEGYYGGHANPVRANPNGAGMYNPDGTSIGLPSDWPPVPLSMRNPIEGYYLPPGQSRAARLPAELETELNLRGELETFAGSVNGIDDYRSSAFNGEMKGDLIAASLNDDAIYRIDLAADGKSVLGVTKLTETGVLGGGSALDVHAAPENGPFAGTLWVASYGGGITVLTPDVSTGPDPVDQDADDDGLNNIIDPFAVDASNGSVVLLQGGSSLRWGFSQNEAHPGPGGIGNLGFTGVMVNGVDAYTALYDPNKTIMGGAAAGVLMQDITAGTPTANNQTDAYQFGIKVGSDVETFTVTAKVNNPFDNTVGTSNQSVGFFIGTGDQGNYVRLVAGAGTVNGVANTPMIDILVESGNSVIAHQTIAAPVFGGGAPAVTAADHFLLSMTVDPTTGSVTPAWVITRGSGPSSEGTLFTGQGAPIEVAGELLKALQGTRVLQGTGGQSVSTGLAVGIIGTSDGPGNPFSATWNSIEITSTEKPSSATGVAELVVTPGGTIDVSTFERGTITLENHSSSNSDLKQVIIDVSAAALPDGVFFDPVGAGGNNGKGFTLNDQNGTFTAGATYAGGSNGSGYRQLILNLNDFNPGESLSFSIDIDPDSMIGFTQSVTAGAISGAELAGSRVKFIFADGSQTEADLFGSGVAQAEARGAANLHASPTLLLQGAASGNVLFPSADPSITVVGTPGATIRVQMMSVAQQFVEFSSPFQGNNATDVVYETVVLDGSGQGTVSATLIPGEVLVIAAAEVDASGRAISAVSQELRVIQGTEGSGAILGTENADVLMGSADADMIDAQGGNDRISGAGGNDLINGGTGNDTVVLTGHRGSYTFSRDGSSLIVTDLRVAGDGVDEVINIEKFEFLGGTDSIVNEIGSTNASETLLGTSGQDFFFFDTAIGLSQGGDGIRNFASGDRIVTTSLFYDNNNDGLIKINSSDRYVLPGTIGGSPSESTGTVKLFSGTGSVISTIKLLGSQVHDGITYFVYAANSDPNTSLGLAFVDDAPPTLTISSDKAALGPGETATVTLTFSEAPTGLTESDIVVESGSIGTLNSSADPKVFSFTYTPAPGTNDPSMMISVAAGAYADAAGHPGAAANLALAISSTASFTGDGEANIFTANSNANWTISGLGGDDVLSGAGGADTIAGGDNSDRLMGGGGNDALDGGQGVDTAVFTGDRSDYTFSKAGGALLVHDLRSGKDGVDTLLNVEKVEFAAGDTKPIGAFQSTNSNETFQGTAAADVFLFDTAVGLALGSDGIRNFGSGDRIVTTTAIFDSNNDGVIRANSSDRFLLPGVFDQSGVDSTGSLKLFSQTGKAMSSIMLVGTDVHDGVTFYVYAANGDLTATPDLLF